MPVRYGYRRVGDDDEFDDLDVDELLALLADDYMENGDLDEAMDRLLREGYETEDGDRVEGLRELLERTRQRRRELEQQADPDGEMQKYRDWLDEIEATEEAELDQLIAGRSGLGRRATPRGHARLGRPAQDGARSHERSTSRTTGGVSQLRVRLL